MIIIGASNTASKEAPRARTIGRAVLVYFVLATVGVAACARDSAPKSAAGDSTVPFTSAADTGDAGGDSTGADSVLLSDANLLYMADQATATDSIAATIAATKATDPEVRQLASSQVAEHHKVRLEIARIAAKLREIPVAPAGDQSGISRRQFVEVLEGVGTGAAFDKAYVDAEVSFHEDVLGDLARAKEDGESDDVRGLLERISTTMRTQLDRARILQKKLGQ